MLRYVPRRQYDAVVKDKPIYTTIDADAALVAPEAFEEKWGTQLPVIGQAWRERWEYVTPFMAYSTVSLAAGMHASSRLRATRALA